MISIKGFAIVVWGFFWTNTVVDDWGTPYPDFSYFYHYDECDAKSKDYALDNVLLQPPECIRMNEAEAKQERWIIEETRRGQGV